MPFFHGIQVNEPVTGVRPILEKSLAVVGLIATATATAGEATNALNLAFPINTPVLVTEVRSAIGVAGSGGTLAKALGAIADQGSPLVVVVRVAEGNDDAATTANVIGGSVAGVYTGLQALLTAEARVGVRPRILGAPGLDNQDVVNALAIAAKSLRGFVYAACRPEDDQVATRDLAVTYANEFSARELMLIWPDLTGWDGKAVATAMGLRAMIDETEGWHKSLSNVPFDGATGISKDVSFDIRDTSTDASVLNQAKVTTLVRMTGYRFWGNRSTSAEAYFAFETATRTAQAIQDAIADGLAFAIDKPMTIGTVRDIEETVNATLRRWTNQGRLIGGSCWFDIASNPPEQLAAGKLVLDYDFTPASPLEGLTLNQRITGKYYQGFGDALNAA